MIGSNLSGTRETGEPLHGAPGTTSIWFRWTAPDNGTIQFRTAGSTNPDGSPMDTLLAAYTGTRINALVSMASNNDAAAGDPTSSLNFTARKGDSYLIAVDGAYGAMGSIQLQWTSPDARFEFRSSTFTAREGQPAATVEILRTGNTGGAASVSFSTAADSAAAGSDFSATSFTLLFQPGQRSLLVQIPLLDDAENEGPESFLVSILNPSAGHSLGPVSTATVQIADDEDAPAEDQFALASTLNGESGSVSVNNQGATLAPGEPVHGPDGGRSVWFVWTAPRNGRATFETMGSLTSGGMPLDTLLAVYTGTALDALEAVARNDNAPLTPTSRVQFTAKAGQTYRIAVDDRSGGGTLLLTFSLVDSDTLLEPIPGLPAPFLEVTESYSESLTGSLATGFTVQPSQKLVATLKSPMGSLTPAFLTPDAPFEIRLGDVQFSGTLGMDPAFSAAKTSARIPLFHTDNQRAGSLQLSWTKTQLTLVLTLEHPELLFEAGDHFGPTGPFAGQVAASRVRFSIANFVATRRLYFSGNTTRTQLTRGTSNFTLHSVSLRAAPDLSGPSIAVRKPLPPAKTTATTVSLAGTLSETRGVTAAQLLLNGSVFPTLILAPALPANSLNFTAANCPLQPGKNSIELRATDQDGNLSVFRQEITRSVLTPVTVTCQGQGSIAGKPRGTLLEIQSSATWTASPAPGWIFDRWSGSVDSTSPTLTAVIAENFLLQANFVPNPFPADSGAYSGLIRSGGATAAGSLSVTLGSSGALTGKLVLASGTVQFKGVVRPDGLFTVSIPRKGRPPLSLKLQFALQGSGQVSGTVSDALSLLQIDAEQDATFATPPESAGAYTVLFQPGAPAFAGHGFATGTVSSKGRLTLAGSLPDGTKFSAGGPLSRDSLFTFLTGLSKPTGQLAGFLSLQNPTDGQWTWSRAASGAVAGFNLTSDATVSRYHPPAANVRLLNSINATNGAGLLSFSSPSLGSHSRTFVLDVKNKAAFSALSPARAVSLSFAPASGVFTGSFQDPVSGANHSFSGIVDQVAGTGAGFFLGPKGPGTLTLSPVAD